jgi:hypothetical protein
MSKRKPIPNGIRFDIFKRDGFKCQYCGKAAPDVILHVDHIKPVAKGGTDEIFNLITSCQECNSGKGKKELFDKTSLDKQRKQLEELEEKRAQLQMMIEWREELADYNEQNIEYVTRVFERTTGFGIKNTGLLFDLLKRFTPVELCEGIDAGMKTYFYLKGQAKAEKILIVLGGICYNRRKNAEKEKENENN